MASAERYAYVTNNPLQVVDLLGLSGDVGTIAGWISTGTGVLGLALDGTFVGAVIGVPLEVVSFAAGGVAAVDDCTGVFGGETNVTVCGLDVASLATAGVGEIAARTAATTYKAADSAARTGVKEYTAAVKVPPTGGWQATDAQSNPLRTHRGDSTP
jgi:hypothetical protein